MSLRHREELDMGLCKVVNFASVASVVFQKGSKFLI